MAGVLHSWAENKGG